MSLVFGIAWAAGAWEWARLVGWSPTGELAYMVASVVISLASGAWFDADGAGQIAWVAAAWWLAAFVAVLRYPWRVPNAFVAAAGILALGPSWFLLTYIHNSGPLGPSLVLGVLCVVWAADVGAYFCGRAFGRVKLAPDVSPGKTWEGVAGGLAAAVLAAGLAGALLGQSAVAWAAVGLITALASVVGDLTVSLCKRRAGGKDSGQLLPGHGGILDRIDSLTAAVPIFFLGASLAGLLP